MINKYLFDLTFSIIGFIILLPLFLFLCLLLKFTSSGPIFFIQKRVGRDSKEFKILKFRTMQIDAEREGAQITIGNRDSRITAVGYYLRKYKLDELPQLINVIKGDMSLVGPRPEVPKYVSLYSETQKKVLSVKPGITDLASIEFRNENEILKDFKDPERAYIEKIMPEKLKLNLKYIQERSLIGDIKLILKTLKVI